MIIFIATAHDSVGKESIVSAAADRKSVCVFQKLTLPNCLYYNVRLSLQWRVICQLTLKMELVLRQEGPARCALPGSTFLSSAGWLCEPGQADVWFSGTRGQDGVPFALSSCVV